MVDWHAANTRGAPLSLMAVSIRHTPGWIALQEASYLYDKLKSISIKDYEIVFSSNKDFNPHDNNSSGKLITLYNCAKYKLLTKRHGSIQGYNSKGNPSTRPFHILFLQDNNNDKKILFINLHNVHDVQRNLFDLQNAINNIISGNCDLREVLNINAFDIAPAP